MAINIGIGNYITNTPPFIKGGEPKYPPGCILAWSTKGKTNRDLDRNILTDLSGNGNDGILYNFEYAYESGYGLYNQSFQSVGSDMKSFSSASKTTLNIHTETKSRTGYWRALNPPGSPNNLPLNIKVKFRVENLREGEILSLYQYTTREALVTLQNGINEATIDFRSTSKPDYPYIIIECSAVNKEVTIELVPEYEGALVFDSVDDFVGTNYLKLPRKEFTLIVKAIPLPSSNDYYIFSKSNLNVIQTIAMGRNPTIANTVASFGAQTNFDKDKYPWLVPAYLTQRSYNGLAISTGLLNDVNTNIEVGVIAKIALYDVILFDRELSEREINKVMSLL